ncbi:MULTISPECIES: hypothetical protein [unclassified Dehalobacter]|uniref:DUF4376 domain-containing protein n=1 Tax=unclassified Dehalobacter TaxID=2635733 RepID=UPI000ED241F2|nr:MULTISPECIES: hypothetical protein [unclassified Dehalobacter]RJE48699.1 hypothetical protein A7K50_10240 [Dehalobacter sp. MCB1]
MILVENEIVISIMDSYEQKENGKLINGCIYPMGEVFDVEAPSEVAPQKYCYSKSRGFYLSQNYVERKTPEQELIDLKKNLGEMPPITPPVTFVDYQENKLYELSKACKEAIYAGIDVTTSQGVEHFSLKEEDQMNLSAIGIELAGGATGFPYHADSTLCRNFSAEELSAIIAAGKAHVTYNTTYYNYLAAWVKRCTTIEEVTAITYRSQLPEDMLTNMNTLLGIG